MPTWSRPRRCGQRARSRSRCASCPRTARPELILGGGVPTIHAWRMLAAELPDVTLLRHEDAGWPSDAKEAIGRLLADAAVRGVPSVLPERPARASRSCSARLPGSPPRVWPTGLAGMTDNRATEGVHPQASQLDALTLAWLEAMHEHGRAVFPRRAAGTAATRGKPAGRPARRHQPRRTPDPAGAGTSGRRAAAARRVPADVRHRPCRSRRPRRRWAERRDAGSRGRGGQRSAGRRDLLVCSPALATSLSASAPAAARYVRAVVSPHVNAGRERPHRL